jgi:tetratricopeptide (TPR) repeat protein
VPTRSPDHAVLGALASYRILLDTLQDNGRLKADYEKAFGGEFHAAFARDYRAWVLEVGKGFKAALDPERFAFFRDRLGPRPATLFAPASWASAGSREDEEKLRACRALAAKSEAGYEEHYRLAVFAAGGQQVDQAIDHLQAALRFSPADGRALLALGCLTARSGDVDTARRYFADCASLSPHTLWSVLAGDEARKL